MLPNFDQQNNQAILSNPANMAGVQGIAMNGGQDSGGMDIDLLIKNLSHIVGTKNLKGLDSYIEDIAINKIKDKNIATKLIGLVNAIRYNNDVVSKNPHVQQNMRTPQEVAQDLIEELVNLKNVKEMNQEEQNQNTQGIKTSQIIKKKKKTRGNPFRVLMGKVQKLLDHGLSKNQIKRSLRRQRYWSDSIIEKAVDVVKAYSRKNKKEAVNQMKRIITSEKAEIEMYKLSYEVQSNTELFMRLAFLKDCVSADVNEKDSPFIPENPAKEINVIMKVLEDRGLE